jgi:WD40 repeat protein
MMPFRASGDPSSNRLVLKEVPLGKYIQPMFQGNPAGLFASADCRHVLYFIKQPGQTDVYVDGARGGYYDSVDSQFLCSIDGQFVFVARRAMQSFVVFNGHEGKPCDKIDFPGPQRLIISPDGQHLAYDAVTRRQHRIVLDGREGRAYEQIVRGTPIFSSDSKHLAYEARRGNTFVVVLDTNEIDEADDVATISGTGSACGICFSPDGQRMAYTIKRADKWIVVSDGGQSPPYATYGTEMSIMFSPDSRRLAYQFGYDIDGRALLVIDGKTNWLPSGDPGTLLLHGNPCAFSPDGKHFAYARFNPSGTAQRCKVVIDGTNEFPGGNIVDTLLYSPDSRRLAYKIRLDDGELVAINGHRDKKYTDIGPKMEFSTNGEHFVYFGRQESAPQSQSTYFMIMDGQVIPLGGAFPKGFIFSPDGKHWAVARAGSKSGLDVLLDGRTVGNYYDLEMPSPYSQDGAIVFSPDSSHMAFRTFDKDQSYGVVVDGIEQKINGQFLFHTTLVFDSPTHLHGLALRGDQIFRFEIDLL